MQSIKRSYIAVAVWPQDLLIAMVKVSLVDGIPIYRQIIESIRSQIALGELAAGDRLPTINQLADDLKISRLTVLRAYQILQDRGFIASTVGKGTVVTGHLDAPRAKKYLSRLTDRGLMPLFETVSHRSSIRSFATSLPDPALVRMDEIALCMSNNADMDPWQAYLPPSAGLGEFVQAGMQWIRGFVPHQNEKGIVVSAGSTAGLNTILQTICEPGNDIVVLCPAIQIIENVASAFRLNTVLCHRQSGKIDFDELEQLFVVHGPKLIIISSLSDPVTGENMTADEMAQLATLAKAHRVRIVDFIPYAGFQFEKFQAQSIAGAHPELDVITNLGLDTHIIAGAALGYILVPDDERLAFGDAQFRMTMGVSSLLQLGFARYLKEGYLQNHIARSNTAYRDRMATLQRALTRYMDKICHWNTPASGLSIWIELPDGIESNIVFQILLEKSVAILPGTQVLCDQPDRHFRFSIAMQNQEAILNSVGVISDTLRRLMAT